MPPFTETELDELYVYQMGTIFTPGRWVKQGAPKVYNIWGNVATYKGKEFDKSFVGNVFGPNHKRPAKPLREVLAHKYSDFAVPSPTLKPAEGAWTGREPGLGAMSKLKI